MALDAFPTLDPEPGSVRDTEVAASPDVLVKAFALGPGGSLSPHVHEGSTNVFHVVEGTVTVISDDETERVRAPGVVVHDPGTEHGARNETDERAVLTATFSPPPG